MNSQTALCAALVLLAATAAVAAPSLFFDRSEIGALRKRAESEVHAELWQRILSEARDLCDRASARYADPEKIDAGGSERIVVRAHTYGRRLTRWAETLGFAYQLTGDEEIGKHGARIVVAAAARLPVTNPVVAKSFAGARGDLMRGFAVGLDWLGEAMTPAERQAVERVAAAYVENIFAEAGRTRTWWVPHHNFMGVALGSAGLLSLKLQDAFPGKAGHWRDECARQITRWFTEGFDEQGAYLEGTLYGIYGLSNAVRFADALRRGGGPDLFDHPRLRHVPQFYAMSLLPGDRVFDARNDAHYGGLSDPLMLRLAGAWGDGLAKWLWERCGRGLSPMRIVWHNGVEPVEPAGPLAMHFAGRGLCVFRTGWGRGDVMLSMEAGPYYRVTHNQADKGHFTLYGLGRRWAIDSGYGNNREPEGRAQTVAHNCVLIDGKGQALTGAGTGTNGRIAAYADSECYGYALAECAEAYNRNSKNQRGVGVKRALRHMLFVRPSGGAPAYAVVLDDIQRDDAQHDYTWLLHTQEPLVFSLKADGAVVEGAPTSGGAFVETPAASGQKGSCTWRFHVAKAGRYVVWARVRAAGEAVGRSDSFFVRMDEEQQVAWHIAGSRRWVWDRVADGVTPRREMDFELAAGEHVLRFETREAGTQVDRVVVAGEGAGAVPVWDEQKAVMLEAEDGQVAGGMRVVREQATAAPPRMRLVLDATGPVRYHVDAYDGHPRLGATVRTVAPQFVAVLMPLPGGVAEPRVLIERGADEVRIEVRWSGRRDRIVWPVAGERRPSVALEPRR